MFDLDIAHFVEKLFFGLLLIMAVSLWLTVIMGCIYGVLKLIFKGFGNSTDEAASEPGQSPKKFKKAIPKGFAEDRNDPTFDDSEFETAKPTRNPKRRRTEAANPEQAEEPAFADRMAADFDAQRIN